MKPCRRTDVGTIILMALMSCLAGPTRCAEGTPTGLAAKALPDLLAPDEGSLALFPASAAGFGPRLVYDRQVSGGTYLHAGDETGDSWSVADPLRPNLALALAGRGTHRVGYLFDGDSHTVLLAATSGWGLSLGWRGLEDGFDRRLLHEHLDGQGKRYTSVTHQKIRDHEFRFGLGGAWRASPDRLLEVGVGGGPLNGTIELMEESAYDTTLTGKRGPRDREGGVRFEAAVRTVSEGPGILAAARYRRDRWNASGGGEPRSTHVAEDCSAQLGWRVSGASVDDISLGCEGSWSQMEESGWDLVNHEETRGLESTLWVLSTFLSLEERVHESLVLRGGVRARVSREVTEVRGEQNDLGDDYEWFRAARATREEKHATFAPEIRLGGAWRWRAVEFEGWLENRVNRYAPFMRWAASLSF